MIERDIDRHLFQIVVALFIESVSQIACKHCGKQLGKHFEKMYDPDEAIDSYSTDIDLSWLPNRLPMEGLVRGILLSADRDLDPSDIPVLVAKYSATAVDWESASIARVCHKNEV